MENVNQITNQRGEPSEKSEMVKLSKIRNTVIDALSSSVLREYPNASLVGVNFEKNEFICDFEFASGKTLSSNTDLPRLETSIVGILKTAKITTTELPVDKALTLAKSDIHRLVILDKESDGKVPCHIIDGQTIVPREGEVSDFPSTINEDNFMLTRVSGAYWQGKENNPMLQRIKGAVFVDKREKVEYQKKQEEAEKRDHMRLGKELKLFTFSELVGAGLPLYTPDGALMRRLINEFVESVQSKQEYYQVWTPQIAKAELFKISGHYNKYKDSMFRVVSNYSDEEFFLKPMNCPQHTQIYASEPRSYRDLPVRITDFAMLYRDEKPGELSGLARVRAFSQDDCHIFCREDQVDEEVDKALEMTKEIMKVFGFKYRYRLSTRDLKHPEKYIGDPKTWDRVEKWAERIMIRNKIDHFDGPGEAAFYAPKMDLIAQDSLGREWQLSTIQIDFFSPEQFKLIYTDKDGKEKRPVMLHRAIVGSPERFLMILIEEFAGAFPTWMSPNQVALVPVLDKNRSYADKVAKQLKDQNIRVKVYEEVEKRMGRRVYEAKKRKIPYVLVVGDKEENDNLVTVNTRQVGSSESIKPFSLPINEFASRLRMEIEKKSLKPEITAKL